MLHPYEVYRDALNRIKEGRGNIRDYDLMEELTEKECFKAPKKLTAWGSDGVYVNGVYTYLRKRLKFYCPECGCLLEGWEMQRCSVCGQALEWYWDDDEKEEVIKE